MRLAYCARSLCVLSALLCVFPACDTTETGGYVISMESLPQQPSSGVETTLTVRLTSPDGAPVSGARVVAWAQLDDDSVAPVTLVEVAPGVYQVEGVVFDEAGEWTLTLEVTGSEGTARADQSVAVGAHSGASVNSECQGGAECQSGVCIDNRCAEATCSDAHKNGDESDVDCGGGTCGPCDGEARCRDDSDCHSGMCSDGRCTGKQGGLIGYGDGSPGSVRWTTVLEGEPLNRPTDIKQNPDFPDQLWVTNDWGDSLAILFQAGTNAQSVLEYVDFQRHFLDHAMAISFGDSGTFATCGDSLNEYDGFEGENDFMGPVMWPSDIEEFAQYGPDAADVHLDMLHSSPQCMGVAAVSENVFFAFNGYDGVLDWYDFNEPHVHGGDDHSDGIKRRYQEVRLKREAGVPSHMLYNAETGWLTIADTGNGRVLKVSVRDAQAQEQLASYEDDGTLTAYTGVQMETFIPTGPALVAPSGLLEHAGILYVSDNGTGHLIAFNGEGVEVNRLDTSLGEGRLGGMTVGKDGLLYIVDTPANRILRIDPRP